MATTKKTTTVETAEKKVDTTPVAAKAEAKKAETKPATKKATTKKTETKKVEAKPAAEKTETKKVEAKPAAKKTTKKAAAKKENNVFVQFAGMEFDTAAIEKAVKEDYKAKNGKKTMTSVSIYIKPEDMKAYYVIDGIIGDIAL